MFETLKWMPFLFFFVFVPCNCALKAIDLCVEPACLQNGGRSIVLLVLVKRRSRIMTYDLAVGGWGPLHPPIAAVASGTDARVTAGRAGPAEQRGINQITVVDGSVGRGPHRLSVEFHLLLWVPEL